MHVPSAQTRAMGRLHTDRPCISILHLLYGCGNGFHILKVRRTGQEWTEEIIKRGIGLFGVGLLLNLFPFFPLYPHDPDATFWQNWTYWIGHIRIFGVLQRIAMAYVIAGLVALWLRNRPRS